LIAADEKAPEVGAFFVQPVVASEAKQSMGGHCKLDCFVALLLAMTENID